MEIYIVCYADGMDEHVIKKAYSNKQRAQEHADELKKFHDIWDAWVEDIELDKGCKGFVVERDSRSY